jgi:hypothetical protein
MLLITNLMASILLSNTSEAVCTGWVRRKLRPQLFIITQGRFKMLNFVQGQASSP